MLQMKRRDRTKMQSLEVTRGKGKKPSPLGDPCYDRFSVFGNHLGEKRSRHDVNLLNSKEGKVYFKSLCGAFLFC